MSMIYMVILIEWMMWCDVMWCDVIDVDGDGDGDFYVQSLFLNLLLNGSLDGN